MRIRKSGQSTVIRKLYISLIEPHREKTCPRDFPTMPDTNRAVNHRIGLGRSGTAVSAQMICAFVFIYAGILMTWWNVLMVEECFENISLKHSLTDNNGEKGDKFVICIILSQWYLS